LDRIGFYRVLKKGAMPLRILQVTEAVEKDRHGKQAVIKTLRVFFDSLHLIRMI
jgi:hypothetical protein